MRRIDTIKAAPHEECDLCGADHNAGETMYVVVDDLMSDSDIYCCDACITPYQEPSK
jgi:hypothetical protein